MEYLHRVAPPLPRTDRLSDRGSPGLASGCLSFGLSRVGMGTTMAAGRHGAVVRHFGLPPLPGHPGPG
eukprot:1709109-Alexandrium_andersonii.AAC.1